MIIYLAGDVYNEKLFPQVNYDFNRLDSFFYVKSKLHTTENIKKHRRYLLDSGAFTFIMNKNAKKLPDIDLFTGEYIDFVNQYEVDYFLEMDVDSVFGYDKVKALRAHIEAKTGRQCIPVFHMERGLSDWNAMCKDYHYIALGVAGKDFARGNFEAFYKLVMAARNHGCKVHGLGITGMNSLEAVPFYSVDSSGWTCGNRYKAVYQFTGSQLKSVKGPELKGKTIKNHEALALHNLKEWIKFAEYMEEVQTLKK